MGKFQTCTTRLQTEIRKYYCYTWMTCEEKLILDSKKKLVTEYEMEDISIMHNFLDLEVWQKLRRDYVESRKVCSGDLEGIWNDGLGIHDYADDDGFIW